MGKHIKDDVRPGCINQSDVYGVQAHLNNWIMLGAPLHGKYRPVVLTGKCDSQTVAAINVFQKHMLGKAYGYIKHDGKTAQILFGPLKLYQNKSASSDPAYRGIENLLDKFDEEQRLQLIKDELRKLNIEGKLSKARLHWADRAAEILVSDMLGSKVVDCLNLAKELAEIATLLPEFTGPIGVAMGIWTLAGPILQFAGFMYLLSDAMDTHIRVYRCVGVAYAITAWASNERCPRRCEVVREALINETPWYGTNPDGDKLDLNWNEAITQTKTKLARLAAEAGTEKTRKIKLTMLDEGKLTLSEALMRLIAEQLPPRRHNESTLLRQFARGTLYPH